MKKTAPTNWQIPKYQLPVSKKLGEEETIEFNKGKIEIRKVYDNLIEPDENDHNEYLDDSLFKKGTVTQ